MVKRSGKNSFGAFWRIPGATAASLVLLLCVEAGLIQKGVLSIKQAEPGIILCCLIAGTVGAALKQKGEGSSRTMLLGCAIPAILLMMSGVVFSEGSQIQPEIFAHAICVILPGLITAMGVELRNKKGKKRRIHRRSSFK
jgi:peptidoglycan/LPS O-acetylase OafA/YrhL